MEFWNELTLAEQLSNIDGEVNRLILRYWDVYTRAIS